MFGVTKKCQVNGCERAASANCFCCNKNVCRRHFMEHTDTVKAQIDPLANDTNEMVENIQSLTIEKITEPSFAQLQQWKIDMHKLIDEVFSTKTKEMEDLIGKNKEKFVEHQKKQLETVMGIQDQVKQLVEDGDVTCEQIQLLKNQLAIVKTNLSNFATNFLVVNTNTTAVQGLVNISTNSNQTIFGSMFGGSPSAFGTASSGPDNSKPAQSFPLFGSAPAQSPFTGFGAACQSKSTVSSPASIFGAVPTATSSPFGSTNSGSPFDSQSPFVVSRQKKK